MAKNKWMDKLTKMSGVVVGDYDPFANGIAMPSPSLGFILANTHLLPRGYTAILYGPPKGGKTLLCSAIVGQMHKDDPEAIAIKFNTEYRETGQMTAKQLGVWGIDPDRYVVYETSLPEEIFDRIEKDIDEMCQAGAPIRLIILDSITGVQGRRAGNADSVLTQQIGDEALTNKDGLKRILPTLRKHKITLLLTAQVRAEMDYHEQQRGKTVKMAAGWYLKHFAEYFIYVERDRTKTGRADMDGNEFKDGARKDAVGNEEQTAHKIKVKIEDSSVSPAGRVGVFTLDYQKGIINTYEEVFLLGVNRGIIQKPNQMMYGYKGQEWKGQQAMRAALRDSPELYAAVLKDLKSQDIEIMKGGGVQLVDRPVEVLEGELKNG